MYCCRRAAVTRRTLQLKCGIVSTRAYVDTSESDLSWLAVFYRNVEL